MKHLHALATATLLAAGLARIDQRDAMALAQRFDGADDADRAGTDDRDVTAGRLHHQRVAFLLGMISFGKPLRTFPDQACPGTKSLPTDSAR